MGNVLGFTNTTCNDSNDILNDLNDKLKQSNIENNLLKLEIVNLKRKFSLVRETEKKKREQNVKDINLFVDRWLKNNKNEYITSILKDKDKSVMSKLQLTKMEEYMLKRNLLLFMDVMKEISFISSDS